MKELIIYSIAFLMFTSIVFSTRVLFNYGTRKGGEPIGFVFSGIYLMLVIVSISLFMFH